MILENDWYQKVVWDFLLPIKPLGSKHQGLWHSRRDFGKKLAIGSAVAAGSVSWRTAESARDGTEETKRKSWCWFKGFYFSYHTETIKINEIKPRLFLCWLSLELLLGSSVYTRRFEQRRSKVGTALAFGVFLSASSAAAVAAAEAGAASAEALDPPGFCHISSRESLY